MAWGINFWSSHSYSDAARNAVRDNNGHGWVRRVGEWWALSLSSSEQSRVSEVRRTQPRKCHWASDPLFRPRHLEQALKMLLLLLLEVPANVHFTQSTPFTSSWNLTINKALLFFFSEKRMVLERKHINLQPLIEFAFMGLSESSGQLKTSWDPGEEVNRVLH